MNGSSRRVKEMLAANLVPVFFFLVIAITIVTQDLNISSITSDVMDRFFRNLFLVTSLIIPIVAGLGLNFGIVLGAMAGQMGLMVVQNGRIEGVGGIGVAVICTIPIAILLGYLTGLLFNRCRGKEMIAGIILGFFAAGIYQFLFLILTGPVIPLHSEDMLLAGGTGLRVTINLTSVNRGLDAPLPFMAEDSWLRGALETVFGEGFDGSIPLQFFGRFWGEIPVLTLIACVLLCVGMVWFFRTRFGQHLRAIGEDAHVAEVAGIPVTRYRIIAVILSIVLAGIGQVIFLQNMGVMNTFTSHEQTGFYAVAALLVGGATVQRATIINAIVGTILCHALIVVIAVASPKIFNDAQIGEYGREFVLYAVIGTTLAIHAWKKLRGEKEAETAGADTPTDVETSGGK